MSRRKKGNSGGDSNNWLNTYADMVTLLLTFFVLMYSSSTTDAEKWQFLVEAFTGGGNALMVNEEDPNEEGEGFKASDGQNTVKSLDELKESMDKLYNSLKEYVEENDLDTNDQVEIQRSEEYVFIRFSDKISFGGYSAILKPEFEKILDIVASGIDEVSQYVEEIIIAGHTALVQSDIDEFGDRQLSQERAFNTLKYIDIHSNIDSSLFTAVGYGRFRPIADNDTEEGRARNRRVEIFISRKGSPKSFIDAIYDQLNNPPSESHVEEDMRSEGVEVKD